MAKTSCQTHWIPSQGLKKSFNCWVECSSNCWHGLFIMVAPSGPLVPVSVEMQLCDIAVYAARSEAAMLAHAHAHTNTRDGYED